MPLSPFGGPLVERAAEPLLMRVRWCSWTLHARWSKIVLEHGCGNRVEGADTATRPALALPVEDLRLRSHAAHRVHALPLAC